MEIIHVSAECYPMAKVGGLGDVVGALPKYQKKLGHTTKVVMPMHHTQYLETHHWEVVCKSSFPFGDTYLDYTIIKEINPSQTFDLYCIDIFNLLDRPNVYGYKDDTERFLAFQLAFVHWIRQIDMLPDIVHVHDHHAGLIPFFMQHFLEYKRLQSIQTVLTIHNAEYQGCMNVNMVKYFFSWDTWKMGLLEWDFQINSLACAIKCVNKVTTVSNSYLQELFYNANGLEKLFQQEKNKCSGIINGIDYDTWNPQTDRFIKQFYHSRNFKKGKAINKDSICKQFSLDSTLPLFIFIGRLVKEKAADLLHILIPLAFETYGYCLNFLVLGNGDIEIENNLKNILPNHFGYYHSSIEYNEALSHQLYAGADFLFMPSRVEPCGLNQMYALRYGTIPIVRSIGGLKDTVIDFVEPNGFGICFNDANLKDMIDSIGRSLELYKNINTVNQIRKNMMTINYSWQKSAKEYIDLYDSIL